MRTLRVLVRGPSSVRGVVVLGGLRFPAAIGRGACLARKREGDGATPVGRWVMREVLYRADRVARPRTNLTVTPIRRDDGWCDAPQDRNYNRRVQHPYPSSAERLWRQDGLYDVIVILGYNDRPRSRGLGSAIFMHVARAGFTPTEGCVALERRHLLRLLARLGRGATVDVLTKKSARSRNSGR